MTLRLLFYDNLLEYFMNTQINVDENLLNQVITLGQCASKEEAVMLALQEFIRHRKQREIIKLFGTLDPDDDYDYKQGRNR